MGFDGSVIFVGDIKTCFLSTWLHVIGLSGCGWRWLDLEENKLILVRVRFQ